MTEHAADLLRAVLALRRAAEAEFHDNRYYVIANEITALSELLPPGSGTPAANTAGTADFASALGAVRKGIEQVLSGNEYYAAANSLAVLASFLPASPLPGATESVVFAEPAELPDAAKPTPNASAETTEGRPEGSSHSAPSFSGLADASKARVEEVTDSLGIFSLAHQVTAPHHADSPETLADGKLERRSSEPCAMAELSPLEVEPLAPAAISAEIPATPQDAEPEADLGPPAVESEPRPIEEAVAAATPEAPAETEPQIAASAHDCEPPTAGETVSLDERKSPEKSLFNLWLDLMFGPKN